MKKIDVNPMKKLYPFQMAPRCSATSKRTGKPCQSPAERGSKVCRFHGSRAGAPKGKANGRYKHGLRTAEFLSEQRLFKSVLRDSRDTLGAILAGELTEPLASSVGIIISPPRPELSQSRSPFRGKGSARTPQKHTPRPVDGLAGGRDNCFPVLPHSSAL
jgi:hypothetical protein